MAGHVRLELRNVVANYPFESSCRFSRNPAEFRPPRLFAFELRRWGIRSPGQCQDLSRRFYRWSTTVVDRTAQETAAYDAAKIAPQRVARLRLKFKNPDAPAVKREAEEDWA